MKRGNRPINSGVAGWSSTLIEKSFQRHPPCFSALCFCKSSPPSPPTCISSIAWRKELKEMKVESLTVTGVFEQELSSSLGLAAFSCFIWINYGRLCQVFSKVCTFPAPRQSSTRPTSRHTLPPPQLRLCSRPPPTQPTPVSLLTPSPRRSTPPPALTQQQRWGFWDAAPPVPPPPPLRSSSGSTAVWTRRLLPASLDVTSPGLSATCRLLP